MLTDLDCIKAVDALYNAPNIFKTYNISGVFFGCIYCSDTDETLIIFRGSITAQDWARDFFAVPHEPVEDPQLGMVHAGFSLGMNDVFNVLKPLLKGKIVVTGHSLGAARAFIYAGLLQCCGITPRVVVFGAPRPGFQKLADILSPVVIASYKNRDDPVTHVPFELLGFDYVKPRDFIQINVSPEPGDAWGILAPHHSALYLKGVGFLCK